MDRRPRIAFAGDSVDTGYLTRAVCWLPWPGYLALEKIAVRHEAPPSP